MHIHYTSDFDKVNCLAQVSLLHARVVTIIASGGRACLYTNAKFGGRKPEKFKTHACITVTPKTTRKLEKVRYQVAYDTTKGDPACGSGSSARSWISFLGRGGRGRVRRKLRETMMVVRPPQFFDFEEQGDAVRLGGHPHKYFKESVGCNLEHMCYNKHAQQGTSVGNPCRFFFCTLKIENLKKVAVHCCLPLLSGILPAEGTRRHRPRQGKVLEG